MKGGIFLEFKANSGAWGTMFGVPCVVADNFLKLATGEQIKVLLYLLRCSGRDCSAEEISANTGVSVQEASDAVLFWQQVNVLTPQQVSASFASAPIQPLPVIQQQQTEITTAPALSPPLASVPENPPEQKKVKNKSCKRTWSGTEIEQIKNESADIAELFEVAESHFGTLNHTRLNSLIYMHEDLGLKKEVIITLISYCCNIGRPYNKYIETIAESWADDDINTFEQANEEVQRLESLKKYENQIMSILQVDRLAKKEKEILEQWKNMNITNDMIERANEIMLEQIHKVSLNYMNKIIKSWYEKGITDINGVDEDEKAHRLNNDKKYNNKHDKQDDGFDVDMYKICINNYEVV